MRDLIRPETSPRVGGRLAGLLFVASGVISAATLPLPQPAGVDPVVILALSGLAVAVGGVAFFMPWHRLHPRANLALLPVAFALVAAGNHYGNAQPYTYSIFFVVAFVWMGLTQPRWTSLWFLPLATAAFVTPIVLDPTRFDAGLTASALVMPICAFVAEAIAWVGARDRRSREQVSALARVATALGPHLDLDSLCSTLTREMRVALQAEQSAFLRFHAGVVDRVYASGFGDPPPAELSALEGAVYGEWPRMDELARGDPVVVEDTSRDDQPLASSRRSGVRSYLAVPVMVGEQIAGILACSERTRSRRYDAHDVTLAKALASHASAALRNALLYEQTLEASRSDPLTGLGNRRAFHERLEQEIERASRHERPLGLIVLDVDHLKYVNDAGGHVAGDRLLYRLAALLQNCSRSEDGVFRLGGDEFAIVLPETTARGAAVAAERVRRRVERGRMCAEGDQHVTVSLGASAFPEHGINPDELFERADTALYEVKWSGRNAVATATTKETAGPGIRFGVDVRSVIQRRALVPLYQPILELCTERVVGYETFCRLDPAVGSLPTATLFRAAASLGLAGALDRSCRHTVLGGIDTWSDDRLLFLNVSPAAIEDDDFDVCELVGSVKEAGLDPRNVVIEVTEQDRTAASPTLVWNLQACRDASLELALDDFGYAPGDIDLLATVPFRYVKIDVAPTNGGEPPDVRKKRLRSFFLVAADAGARAVAEGVETTHDLGIVRDVGFEWAQGHHFRPPSPTLASPARPVKA